MGDTGAGNPRIYIYICVCVSVCVLEVDGPYITVEPASSLVDIFDLLFERNACCNVAMLPL